MAGPLTSQLLLELEKMLPALRVASARLNALRLASQSRRDRENLVDPRSTNPEYPFRVGYGDSTEPGGRLF